MKKVGSKIFLLIFVSILIVGCNKQERRIISLASELENVNLEIINQAPEFDDKSILEYLKTGKNELIRTQVGSLIIDNKLSKIDYKSQIGIFYNFRFQKRSDGFFNYKNEYYLIKIIDEQKLIEILQYEQFVDYRTKLEKLNNDWYYIKIVEYFD